MIHIVIGTKAQLIKMAPIIQQLDSRRLPYNLIDLGQHAGLITGLITQFGLQKPDVTVHIGSRNINTIAEAIRWIFSNLYLILLKREETFRQIFKGRKGICLIHGDTLTTLISLLFAKSCGLKVAHVEAGLRSYHLLDPFPEEIIRLIAMRFSDLLFAPSDSAFQNLVEMGYEGKTVNIGMNTGLDSIRFATRQPCEIILPQHRFGVITIHRVETIFSRSRLLIIMDLISSISKDCEVIFVMHEPTRHQMLRYGLIDQIENRAGVRICSLLPYVEFINLLDRAEFVITDGGSIQEECYYLNKPCMLMRSKTERREGLGENVFISDFDADRIKWFLENYQRLKRKHDGVTGLSPSEKIVDHLMQMNVKTAVTKWLTT